MPNIRHELVIAASAEKVYNAITTQEGLASWWTPETKAKPDSESIARFPFGDGYFKEMKIVELVPDSKVKWNCIAGADEWIGTDLAFELKTGDPETLLKSNPELKGVIDQVKDNQLTLLIFQHDNWKEYTSMFAECNYTWAQFLRSLKLYCETGKGRPWPNQHRIDS